MLNFYSLEAVLRLFRIILDIKSPSFQVEGRQWRPSVIEIFYHYFSTVWADQKVILMLECLRFC
jgi:hypothetical protein